MTGQNSVSTFLRTVLIFAALAGATAGVVLATNEAVRTWHADGMQLGDMAYVVAVAGMLLLTAVVYMASRNARRIPVVPLALIAIVLGVAFGRFANYLTGTPEGLVGASAYLFDGLGIGMLVAYWMMRRAGRGTTK